MMDQCGIMLIPTTLALDATVERLIDKMTTSPDIPAPEVYVKNAFAPVYDLSEAASGIGFYAEYDVR